MGDRECAFVVCRDNKGKLSRGAGACGDRRNVSVPVRCHPGSRPVAILHNHPSGNPRASVQDLQAAREHRVAVCVKTRGIKCYVVRSDRK